MPQPDIPRDFSDGGDGTSYTLRREMYKRDDNDLRTLGDTVGVGSYCL